MKRLILGFLGLCLFEACFHAPGNAGEAARCYDWIHEIACGGSDFPRQEGDFPASQKKKEFFLSPNQLVITDNVSGHVWMRCSAGARLEGGQCSGAKNMTWNQAQEFCRQLNLNDFKWRLPTIIELNGLLDLNHKGGVKIAEQFFPGTQKGAYWTSNDSFTPPDNTIKANNLAWFISFETGAIFDAPKTIPHFVRCVSQ